MKVFHQNSTQKKMYLRSSFHQNMIFWWYSLNCARWREVKHSNLPFILCNQPILQVSKEEMCCGLSIQRRPWFVKRMVRWRRSCSYSTCFDSCMNRQTVQMFRWGQDPSPCSPSKPSHQILGHHLCPDTDVFTDAEDSSAERVSCFCSQHIVSPAAHEQLNSQTHQLCQRCAGAQENTVWET